MGLGEGDNKWLCGGIKEETEERVTKTVVLDNWEQYRILVEKSFPECHCSGQSISQARTLTSCNVLEGTRLTSTARYLTVAS